MIVCFVHFDRIGYIGKSRGVARSIAIKGPPSRIMSAGRRRLYGGFTGDAIEVKDGPFGIQERGRGRLEVLGETLVFVGVGR